MRILGVLLVGAALSAVGCSSSSGAGAPAGSGGAGSSKLPAQGSFSISVSKPTMQVGTACPVVGQEYQLGNPKPPSLLDPGDSAVDGSAGTTISCSVKGPAPKGPYSFSGSIQGTSLEGDPVTLQITDGALDTTYDGSVSISVFTPQLAGTFASSMPCSVHAINSQAKPGSIWAELTCAHVTSSPSGDCSVNGELVLENCDGS